MNALTASSTTSHLPAVVKSVMRVLVVEDDNNDRELLQRQFVKAGIIEQVSFAATGTDAWRTVLTDSESATPTLCAVLLDLKIPGLSGIELLKMLRQRPETKALPVFIVSGSTDPRQMAECETLGISGFVAKPISYSKFRQAIATIFHQKTVS